MSAKRLLVTLDVLLDTRLGVIAAFDDNIASTILNNPEYLLREHEDWSLVSNGLITNDKVDALYSARGGVNTADTLNASLQTSILPFIHQLLIESDLARMNNRTEHDDELKLCVDIHPYELSLEYRDELLTILKELFGDSTDITITSLGLEQASPNTLYASYGGYITYEFNKWIKHHYLELSTSRMTDFTFIGPKLFEKDVSKLEPAVKKRELLRFKLEKLMYMTFEFIDAKYFSILSR